MFDLNKLPTPAEFHFLKSVNEKYEALRGSRTCLDVPAQEAIRAAIGFDFQNEHREKLELVRLLIEPEEREFQYVTTGGTHGGNVTTWSGSFLGGYVRKTSSSRPAIEVQMFNGHKYRGQIFPNSGDYCSLRKITTEEQADNWLTRLKPEILLRKRMFQEYDPAADIIGFIKARAVTTWSQEGQILASVPAQFINEISTLINSGQDENGFSAQIQSGQVVFNLSEIARAHSITI